MMMVADGMRKSEETEMKQERQDSGYATWEVLQNSAAQQ